MSATPTAETRFDPDMTILRAESSAAALASDPAVRHRMVEVGSLTDSEIARWLELRASNPGLDSPYFHPGFTAAVAESRPGVRVIVGEDRHGVPASFLPVQVDKRIWRAAGAPAADFQGPVCASGVDFDIASALRASGASRYEFDHMRDGIPGLEPWVLGQQPSPYLDVTGGIEGYLERASRSGRDKVAEARRLSRKVEREHGTVRFVAQAADSALLDSVIAMKRRQYADTGSRDYFADPQHVALMHRLLSHSDADFGGLLSAVYAGPHLLAAHFGLRAGPVLHWWFPVYDPAFGRFSPGWILLRAVTEAAPQLGLERIDLGRGVDDYKRRAMTGYQIVSQGAVIHGALRHQAVLGQRRIVAAVKSSRLAPTLRSAVRHARSRRR